MLCKYINEFIILYDHFKDLDQLNDHGVLPYPYSSFIDKDKIKFYINDSEGIAKFGFLACIVETSDIIELIISLNKKKC